MGTSDISRTELVKGYEAGERAVARAAKYKESMRRAMRMTATGLEAGASAFLVGLVQGRTQKRSVMGVPIGLGIAAVAVGGAVILDEGKGQEDAFAVGVGAGCSYLSTLGMGIGNKWRTTGSIKEAFTPPVGPQQITVGARHAALEQGARVTSTMSAAELLEMQRKG